MRPGRTETWAPCRAGNVSATPQSSYKTVTTMADSHYWVRDSLWRAIHNRTQPKAFGMNVGSLLRLVTRYCTAHYLPPRPVQIQTQVSPSWAVYAGIFSKILN